jgi:uncharacterized protein YegL
MILSITARLDELQANIINDTSVFSDGESRGIDELFEWLSAVASATSQGPVLLVFTFADRVSTQVTVNREELNRYSLTLHVGGSTTNF